MGINQVMNRSIFTGWALLLVAALFLTVGIIAGWCLGIFVDGKYEAGWKAAEIEMQKNNDLRRVFNLKGTADERRIAGAKDEDYRRVYESR